MITSFKAPLRSPLRSLIKSLVTSTTRPFHSSPAILLKILASSKPLNQNPTIKNGSLSLQRTYAMDRLGEKIDTKIDEISDTQYNRISNDYLEDLGDELEAVGEDYPSVDFELSQGVLTLNTTKGTYVINRQPPTKQMWLSSPLTGPNRYDLIGGQWVSLRDHGKLTELLSRELSEILETELDLQLEN